MNTAMYTWKEYVLAGNPVIWMVTHENQRAIGEISTLAKHPSLNRAVVTWNCVDGGQNENGGSKLDKDPIKAILALREPNFPTNTIVIMQNLQFFLKNPQVMQGMKNLLPVLKHKAINVVVVSPVPDVPVELCRDIAVTDLELPSEDQLREVLEMAVEGEWFGGYAPKEEEIPVLVGAAKGLTLAEAEDAFSMCFARHGKLTPEGIALMKAKMVATQSALEWSRHTETFGSLGGFGNAKDWALRRFNQRRAGVPWKGMLFVGVPGCGKTHFARALGNEVGWPCIELKLSQVSDSKVGGSEAKMDSSLKAVKAVGKCVLLMDEIEKGLAGTGGVTTDSGAKKGMANVLLQFLQNPDCDVFPIATCNNLYELPPEFTRFDRWGGIFFVDLPNGEERNIIANIYLQEYMNTNLEEVKNFPDLEGYSGAEIKNVVIEACYNGGNYAEAAKFVVPQSASHKEGIDGMRKEASNKFAMASYPAKPAKKSLADVGKRSIVRS
jgi:hypothetical protein